MSPRFYSNRYFQNVSPIIRVVRDITLSSDLKGAHMPATLQPGLSEEFISIGQGDPGAHLQLHPVHGQIAPFHHHLEVLHRTPWSADCGRAASVALRWHACRCLVTLARLNSPWQSAQVPFEIRLVIHHLLMGWSCSS